MKTILLVDDEMLVRAGLRTIVDWNANGYGIIGEATSGHDAMRMIEQTVPDILLLDLLMDNGNGLELIEWCKNNYPQINIIVLSNYTDYDKVRAAMKMGAKDYLFKLTTKGEEILQVLSSLQIASSDDLKHQQIERSANALRQQLFLKLFNNDIDSIETWKSDFRYVSGSFSIDQPFNILYIRLVDFSVLTGSQETENATATATLEKSISDHFCSHAAAQFFRYKAGKYYVLINTNDNQDDAADEAEQRKAFYTFSLYCERYFGIQPDCAFYGPCRSFDDLFEKALKCKDAMNFFFYLPQGSFLNVEALAPQNVVPQVYNEIVEITKLLDVGDYSSATVATEKLFAHMEHEQGNVQKARELLNKLYVHLWDSIRAKGLFLDEYADGNNLSLYEAIYSYDHLCTIRKSFLEALQYFSSQRHAANSELHPLVLQAIAYIQDHLKEELSIPSLCQKMHLSESAFTRLFKNETGTSMVKYINSIRIERACALLIASDMRVQEIADEVGIENPNYFSILFKKSTGLSPNEYRAKHS